MANKKLNLGTLKRLESKTFTQKKVIIDKYEVLVDEVFRDSKMAELMKESLEKTTYAQENDFKIDYSEYAMVLILKYFTSLDVPDKFEEQIQFLSILIDLGYFEIIVEAIPENEIKRLEKKIKQYGDNAEKLIEDLKKEEDSESMDEVEEEIE